MSTELAKRPAASTPVVATSWEQMTDVIRKQYPGVADAELAVFFYQAKRMGLDPLARQIHLVTRAGKSTIQTGIDGYRAIADRTGAYAGNDEPQYDEGLSQFEMIAAKRQPKTATVTVYKLVGGVRCAFTATAAWDAYCPKGDAFMWQKMPFLMLGKCAEALAFRKAFPQDLSGVYTDEEMHQADAPKVEPVKPVAQIEAKPVEAVAAPAPVDEPMPAIGEDVAAPAEPPADPCTDAQCGLIDRHLGRLGMEAADAIKAANLTGEYAHTKKGASQLIQWLMTQPTSAAR